jgi:hypothetical protein
MRRFAGRTVSGLLPLEQSELTDLCGIAVVGVGAVSKLSPNVPLSALSAYPRSASVGGTFTRVIAILGRTE